MTKTLLPLVLGVSSLAAMAHAKEDINLQGYYKSKAAIKFAVDKIQQNKVGFMNLDKALTLTPSTSPQTLASIDDIANSKPTHTDVFVEKAKEFNLTNKVCVIAKDGAIIAFEVDAGVASCDFDVNKVDKAMAKTAEDLVFFQRYGSGQDIQYFIDKISLNGQDISNTYLYKSNDKLLGDIAKVKKDTSSKFTIEHYIDSGPADGTKIGYRAYQWANDFSDDQKMTINSLSYQYGPNVMLNNQKTAFFWAIKDYVSPSNADANFYFSSSVSRLARSVDNKVRQGDKYSAQSPSDLIAYNFNNANKLVGLSPDACTIKQIADGKKSVTWYKGFNRGKDCTTTAADLVGKVKMIESILTNDGSKKVSVASLQKSASDIIAAVEVESASASDLTDIEFAAMKAKYDAATKQYKDFNSIQFWK